MLPERLAFGGILAHSVEAVVITLVLIGLVGGMITGISPCVLPVLPVVFMSGGVPQRAGEATSPRGGRARPYLIVGGLALSFATFTLLGTLVLSALPLPKDIIRWAGLIALVLLGIAMIFPRVQHILERPFTRLGQRQVSGERGAFALGLALGAVYVPCAGPVLAAITVAGATGHIGASTVALTVAFAVGTAIPLLGFALAGRAVAQRVRAFRDRQRGVRIVAGLVLVGLAVALTFNVTDVLQRSVPDYTQGFNNALNDRAATDLHLGAKEPVAECAQEPSDTLQNCGEEPAISGISSWLNTPDDTEIALPSLRGKVVLVDFWAYSCINCQRAIPHVEAWYQRYHAAGLEVIGVHTPEYTFEHVRSDVAAGARRLHITYPVALDNDYKTWNNFDNQSWPADYLIDANGIVRHATIGEGDYRGTENLIRALLHSAAPGLALPRPTDVADNTPTNQLQTAESYLGSARSNNFQGNDNRHTTDGTDTYRDTDAPGPNMFTLTGTWTVTKQSITAGANARIELNYDASDVYLDTGGTGALTATSRGVTTVQHVSGAPNIYTVAHSASPRRGIVSIAVSPGLRCYSFTFG
jgi:cytochrome c biogenesis protein CcdA/thiol-disulfide isomerase/thioredoxin